MVQPEAERGGELSGEGEATPDPLPLLPQQLPDGGDREAVVVGQGRGDVSLVHGADRASGGIGGQEPGFHGDSGGSLDDDGNLFASLGDPSREALEAVDHLVDTVADGGDADGKRSEEDAFIAALPTKDAQGSPKSVHGDVLDEDHGEPSSDRSWKSG